jgi:hypothetical protein
MSVENTTAVQILLAWRDNKWVVSRNATEVGVYPYRTHALEAVRRISDEARAAGLDCYLLERDRNGGWRERPCPGSGRAGRSARTAD